MANALLEAASSFGKYLDRLKSQAGGQLATISQQVSPSVQQVKSNLPPIGNVINQFKPDFSQLAPKVENFMVDKGLLYPSNIRGNGQAILQSPQYQKAQQNTIDYKIADNPVGRTFNQYAVNRFVNPLVETGTRLQAATRPNSTPMERAGDFAGAGLSGLSATFNATPLGLAWNAYEGQKARMASPDQSLRGQLSSFRSGLVGDQSVGLGSALARGKPIEEVLNTAEIPLTILATHRMSKVPAINSKDLKDVTYVWKTAQMYDRLNPEGQMRTLTELQRWAEKYIPDVVKNKEVRQLSTQNPGEWRNVVTKFLEDKLVQTYHPEAAVGMGIRTIKKMPAVDYLDDLKSAIGSGDIAGAKNLYKEMSRDYNLPKFADIQAEVENIQKQIEGQAKAQASASIADNYGSYKDIANKMRQFLSLAGDKVAKEGLEFQEHIPKRIFGIGSDQVATALGMDENTFMQQLKKEADLVSSGKASFAVQKSFSDKVKTIKSFSDKLSPDFYSVVKDSLGKVGAVTAEATPETLAKIAKQEAAAKLKAANRTFEEWRNSYRSETISPTEALNRGIKAVQQSTDDAIKAKLAAQGKDVVLIDWRSPENVFKKFGVYDEVYIPLKKGQEATAKIIEDGYQKLNQWHKNLGGNKDSQLKVFQWLDGGNVPLSPTEQKVAVEIKAYLKDWADKLGLPEDKRITHYITHIFEPDLAGGKRVLPEELARILDYIRPRGVTDPFLKQRTGALGYKQDLFGALDSYIRRGARKLYLDKPIDNAAKYADAEGTQAQNYLDRFLKNLQGRPDSFEKWIDQNILQSLPAGVKNRLGARPVKQVVNSATGTVYRAALGLNLGSALKNLTQGVNTLAEIGPKNTMLGYTRLLKNGTKELIDNGVIDDMLIADYRRTPIKNAIQRMDNVLFWMFEMAEKINRGSAYYGAKAQAMARGIPEAQAIEYAKSIVRKTQFAYGKLDTPLGLQNSLGKVAFQFSTFPIKQAELVGGWAKNREGRKLATYIASSLALTAAVGDLLGLEYSDMFFKNIVPGLGPIPETIKAGISVAGSKMAGQEPNWQDKRDLQNAWRLIAPAGVQADKTFQGLKADVMGGVYTAKGKLSYPIKSTTDKIIAPLLGVYRTGEANKYYAQRNADDQARSQAQNKGVTQSGNKVYYFDGETTQSISIDPYAASVESKNGINAVAARIIRASQQFNPKSSMTVQQAVDIVHQMGADPGVAYSLAQKSETAAGSAARSKAQKILTTYGNQPTQQDKEKYMDYLKTQNLLTPEILQAIKEIESE